MFSTVFRANRGVFEDVPSASGLWTGKTGSFTFTGDDLEHGGSDDASIRLATALSHNFQFEWTFANYNASQTYVIGAFDASEVGTFNQNDAQAGLSSMTDSIYMRTSASNDYSLRAGSTIEQSGLAISNGDTCRWERHGEFWRFFRNGSLVRTMTATFAGPVYFCCGGGNVSPSVKLTDAVWRSGLRLVV